MILRYGTPKAFKKNEKFEEAGKKFTLTTEEIEAIETTCVPIFARTLGIYDSYNARRGLAGIEKTPNANKLNLLSVSHIIDIYKN